MFKVSIDDKKHEIGLLNACTVQQYLAQLEDTVIKLMWLTAFLMCCTGLIEMEYTPAGENSIDEQANNATKARRKAELNMYLIHYLDPST